MISKNLKNNCLKSCMQENLNVIVPNKKEELSQEIKPPFLIITIKELNNFR
jgi:hypothetical protein